MGPTASGKSDVAIKLARIFNGEIISADSRQVYKGMDIGTGKVPRQLTTDGSQPSAEDLKEGYFSEGIRHYLIDVAEPNIDFNVSHFKTEAEKAIETILAKGKVPIICGGTGFWIQAVTDDMDLPQVKPDEKLRKELDKLSAEELFQKLKQLDPERAENIDKYNKYRLIRALEIIEAIGKVPNKSLVSRQSARYEFLQIGIEVNREILNAKIKKRLDARFNEGMTEEVENLHENGVSWERLETFGLEYRWIARFLQEKISADEMKEKLYFDIIHYAKRQMTWLRRNKKIRWKENYQEIEKEVSEFFQK